MMLFRPAVPGRRENEGKKKEGVRAHHHWNFDAGWSQALCEGLLVVFYHPLQTFLPSAGASIRRYALRTIPKTIPKFDSDTTFSMKLCTGMTSDFFFSFFLMFSPHGHFLNYRVRLCIIKKKTINNYYWRVVSMLVGEARSAPNCRLWLMAQRRRGLEKEDTGTRTRCHGTRYLLLMCV